MVGEGERRGMSAGGWPRPPRSRMLVGLILALLVQGSWLMLLQLGRPSGKSGTPARIELRLLAPDPERQQAAPVRAVGRGALQIRTPLPVSAPMIELEAWPARTGPAADSAPAPAAAPPAPLRLALPVERSASGPRADSMLSQMLNDPRARSIKRTVESALADAAGTLPVTVQSSTDGRDSLLIRQGSKCIRVTQARIKTLHPMDENAKGAPAAAGACVTD